jgi:hypothetical protein
MCSLGARPTPVAWGVFTNEVLNCYVSRALQQYSRAVLLLSVHQASFDIFGGSSLNETSLSPFIFGLGLGKPILCQRSPTCLVHVQNFS